MYDAIGTLADSVGSNLNRPVSGTVIGGGESVGGKGEGRGEKEVEGEGRGKKELEGEGTGERGRGEVRGGGERGEGERGIE